MKIALGVTGSISAYKALDLCRELTKLGHKVRVILTRGSLEFIQPKVFTYLGAEKVYDPSDDFSELSSHDQDLQGSVLHVSLAKWADQFVIAPLSANTLSHLTAGAAPDLLTSLFLAWHQDKPLSIFPAMNTHMLTHPFVKENLEKFSGFKNCFVGPTQSGLLACADVGDGKLAKVEEILKLIETRTLKTSKKTTLITAGATVAPLDNVRYLTNAASGKTSIPFIEKSLSQGDYVICIAGIYATKELELFKHHPHFKIQRVRTTREMQKAVLEAFPLSDLYISTAAIGDFEFVAQEKKLKKSDLSNSLKIESSPDILRSVLDIKKPHQKVIGFAAESDLCDEVLLTKFKRKPVDLLIGTQVHSGLTGENQAQGFAESFATYRFVDHLGKLGKIESMTKEEMVTKAMTCFNS